MDARAPASMRLLLSYSRARKSILLSKQRRAAVCKARRVPITRAGTKGEIR
jgi:hypothetical protein